MKQSLLVCASIALVKSYALAGPLPAPEPPFPGKITASAADSIPVSPQPWRAPNGAPNIIVVLLDDVGFGASETFGGPVKTPEMSWLAAHGLRYNNFTVSAQCSPTRAALLTGRNDHHEGFGTVSYGGYPGYNNVIRKSTVLFADVLRRNGYSTAAVGKWHNTPTWESSPVGPFDRWPTGLGFEYFYGFMGALDSEWEPALYRGTSPVDTPSRPADGYYLTTDLVDEGIGWIQTHESLVPQKPYLLYLATGATHEPHHVGKEWVAKYQGKFDQGWDKLREEIYERQKSIGVIPANTILTPRAADLPAWDTYSADEHKILSHQMEVYAGYLEETDHEVGRLLRFARENPGGDNTLIFYIIGDNGASAEGGLHGIENFNTTLTTPLTVQERLQHMDELGGPAHFNHYASAWAWALCSPFKWEKLIASHFGGTRNPLIVSWPARIKNVGGIRPQFSHVTDIAATIYDVSGIEFPQSVDSVIQLPLDGVSLADSFDRPDAPSRHRLQIFEQWGTRAIYRDGWIASTRHGIVPWKLGAQRRDYDFAHDTWELYHVETDFSEANDLARQEPAKLAEMRALFDQEAPKNDIYPLGGSGKGTDIPRLSNGRKVFVYYPTLPRMQPYTAPNFGGSHRISAEVVIPKSGASGVIISEGGRTGGFVLYVMNNRLIYENNTAVSREVITSTGTLPAGSVELAYEFQKDQENRGGTGRLLVNGQPVGEAKFRQSAWGATSGYNIPGTFGVGNAYGSPVSPAFETPFKFSGILKQVKVELADADGSETGL